MAPRRSKTNTSSEDPVFQEVPGAPASRCLPAGAIDRRVSAGGQQAAHHLGIANGLRRLALLRLGAGAYHPPLAIRFKARLDDHQGVSVMRRCSVTLSLLVLIFIVATAAPAHAQTRLLRFPDIHDSQVVFCYAGDLWLAPAEGGTATRLTAHPGVELFPKFSPDGRWIAFTGQYDGDEQVYVIPSSGGIATATHLLPGPGALAAALGLRQPGLRLDRRRGSRSSSAPCVTDGEPDRTPASVLVSRWTEGLLDTAAVARQSGGGDLSPDGSEGGLLPSGSGISEPGRGTEGGWAQELYVFDLEHVRVGRGVTDRPVGPTGIPMWIGEHHLLQLGPKTAP